MIVMSKLVVPLNVPFVAASVYVYVPGNVSAVPDGTIVIDVVATVPDPVAVNTKPPDEVAVKA